ncbi:MAG: 50S ribosomal protein L7/L12 [Planctomycetes bacterium]|nr:50S ribosomal protein L7/L12 [Planctomycetota bacterium]
MSKVEELLKNSEGLEDQEKVEFLANFISKQNVLWLANAVKALEDKFGVKAQAVAVAAPGASAPAEKEVKEEKTSFDVILKSLKTADAKLNVIKSVRAITNLGLKESKDLVEKLPQTVKTAIAQDEANKIKDELEKSGAVVELK